VLRRGVRRVLRRGGLAPNGPLGAGPAAEPALHGTTLPVPPPRLCTDNPAMTPAAGTARLRAGERPPLGMNARPDMELAPADGINSDMRNGAGSHPGSGHPPRATSRSPVE